MLSATVLLIIASSGRMLAEAAKNAGFKPLVVDLYADTDTEYYAEAVLQVSSLAVEAVTAKVNYFIDRYSVAYAIYGSGLESYPETLVFLESCLTVLGNAPEVFETLHDKPVFFSRLDALAVPYPEVVYREPSDAGDWLIKPMRGQGGQGIKFYDRHLKINFTGYWQKHQAGLQYSILFIADGLKFVPVGFNRQWTVNLGAGREFIFSGISNHCALTHEAQSEVTRWLEKIVPAFGLKGLNALDFIDTSEQLKVLEINPRPSASMQLYDADLLLRHIQACRGDLLAYPGLQEDYRAFQVVYAARSVSVPCAFEWPVECRDLPKSGAIISTGQPVCSIIARHSSAQQLQALLRNSQQTLLNKLYDGS